VTLEALSTVVADTYDRQCTLNDLVSLAEQSLVLPVPQDEPAGDDDPEPAFSMLETVREYAWEHLDRLGELEAGRHAHAPYFLALAERVDPLPRGPDQRTWL